MNIGMLWYFKSGPKETQKSLEERVSEAVAYYKEKYGKPPNRGFLHPSMSATLEPVISGLPITYSRSIMQPNHIWLGVEEEDEQDAA